MKAAKKVEYITGREQQGMIMPVIARLASPGKFGEIMVAINDHEPRNARIVSGLDRNELTASKNTGREVLIVFEKGDPDLPIVLAMMESPLDDMLAVEVQVDEKTSTKDVLVDGKRITIAAEDEVVLKCGKGSIKIKKDGKIIVKGSNLLSRSSGSNRIKGASVNIN